MNIEQPRIILLTGVPGAGKTSVAAVLASKFPRSAHVEADVLRTFIRHGGVNPDGSPRDEADRAESVAVAALMEELRASK